MPAIMTNTGMNSAMTKSAMRGANQEAFNPVINGRSFRPPLRMIYIYSVAKRAFTLRKPPLFPKLHLAGCEAGERWVRCTSFGDPILQPCPDQERGGTRIDDNDGWVEAIDMLNPGNFTMDPYAGSTNPTFFTNTLTGTNLIAEGLFPSLNDTPTEEEIKRAENARDKHYQHLTKEAMRLYALGAKQGNEFLQRFPDTHIAMDALGLEATWHQTNTVKQSCPNCGDSIKPGMAFHKSSVTDRLCVIDAMKAYKAKAITRDEYEELTGEKLPGRRASAE